MTNNSPFDDHIKKQLGNFQPEVPSHVWENVLANKEKRRPGGLLFNLSRNRLTLILIILILATGGTILVHQYNSGANTKSSINEPLVSATITKTSQNGFEKNEEINKQENKLSGNRNQDAVQSDRSQLTGGPANNKINAIQADGALTATNISNDLKKNDTRSDGLTEPIDKISNTNQTAATFSTKSKNKIKNSGSQTRMNISDPGTESTTLTGVIAAAVTKNVSYNDDLSLSKYYLNLNSSQGEKTFLFSVKNINMAALNIPCPAIEKNAAGNKRYFEIYGGPDYVFRSYNDTANSSYLQKRKESTHFSSAFSLGARYTRVFNNAMSFRAGINFSQVNEKFRFEQGHIVQLVYIIDQNGDTTGSYATTGTRYKTTYNRYRTLDIPLGIGYEMGNGKLHTNINAALVINIYSWQRGDVLNNDYQPVNITTGKSSSPYQFKTNIGLGFMGGVSFYYKLTSRLHILGEPYFRYNFSAANKADITLKQKYTTAGLRLGIRFDF